MKPSNLSGSLRFDTVRRVFIESVTVKSIYEKIACCNKSESEKAVIKKFGDLNFDVIGVLSESGTVDEYIDFKAVCSGSPLKEATFVINIKNVVSDSTPIANLVALLKNKPYLFVNHGDQIEGIVTRADINKPVVRLYLFGLVTLLETSLNTIVQNYFPSDIWLDHLSSERTNPILQLYKTKVQHSEDLSIIECAQFCDKKQILLNSPNFLSKYDFSKTRFKRFMERAEKLRNSLAHSNSTITSELKWDNFAECVISLEHFLLRSEM